jgi:hypothetical protein
MMILLSNDWFLEQTWFFWPRYSYIIHATCLIKCMYQCCWLKKLEHWLDIFLSPLIKLEI